MRQYPNLCFSRLSCIAMIVGLFFAVQCGDVYGQSVQTPASEAHRLRSQQEAAERDYQLYQSGVALTASGAVGAVHDMDLPELPVETPCYVIHQFTLAVPEQLPLASRLAGASVLPQDPFRFVQDYADQYRGACIGPLGLNLIAKYLSRIIMQKGYSTTRLGIPRQDLSSGTLLLTLVPGMVRTIRFSDPDWYGTWRNAFPDSIGHVLNLRKLEQGLEQLKLVPSQDVSMQIIPSGAAGESDVLLDVTRVFPARLSVSLDDSGAKSTGKIQAGLNLAIDNLLGLSDLFNIGIHSNADRGAGVYGTAGNSIYYAVPAGSARYSVSAGNNDYYQQISGIRQSFISHGDSSNVALKLNQLIQRDQSQKNSLELSTGKRWSRSYIDGIPIGVQKRNTTYVELGWIHKHDFGRARLDLSLTSRWGTSAFKGMDNPAWHKSGDPTFLYTLQSLDAVLVAPFSIATQPVTYVGTLRGQISRSRLYLADQFSIGGRYTVRGFDGESTLTAESGFFVRNELDFPVAKTAHSVYLGLDFGKVFGPGTVFLSGDTLTGTAAGVRGVYKGFTYNLFSSWSLSQPASFRSSRPALGFNVTFQY